MATEPLPADVRDLLSRHLPSMDHVTVLLAMREASDVVHVAASMAPLVHVDQKVATSVFADLVAARLIAPRDSGFVYQPDPRLAEAVESLAEMYNTRPVTLVRAIYDRPTSPAKSFADAFRIRKREG